MTDRIDNVNKSAGSWFDTMEVPPQAAPAVSGLSVVTKEEMLQAWIDVSKTKIFEAILEDRDLINTPQEIWEAFLIFIKNAENLSVLNLDRCMLTPDQFAELFTEGVCRRNASFPLTALRFNKCSFEGSHHAFLLTDWDAICKDEYHFPKEIYLSGVSVESALT